MQYKKINNNDVNVIILKLLSLTNFINPKKNNNITYTATVDIKDPK